MAGRIEKRLLDAVKTGNLAALRTPFGSWRAAAPSGWKDKAGVDVNEADRQGKTALYEACYCGETEIVKLLLERGANGNAVSTSLPYATPLQAAGIKGHVGVVQILLEAGVDTLLHSSYFTHQIPVVSASRLGQTEVVRLILDRQKQNVEENETITAEIYFDAWKRAFLAACERGAGDLIRLWLQEEKEHNNLTFDYTEALQNSCGGGHYNVVQQLLTERPEVVDLKAIRNAHNQQTLLHAAANAPRDKRTLPQLIRLLCERGVDVHAVDRKGQTALHHASNKGNDYAVQCLLEQGAESTPDSQEQFPLDLSRAQHQRYAAYYYPGHNYPNVIKLLEEAAVAHSPS